MIRHSVIFKFKTSINADEKQTFFEAVNTLKGIENVQQFEVLRQISPKNQFEYGISMEFDTDEQYEQYTIHPDHVYFVQNFWVKAVADFLEMDYQL